MDRDRCIYFLNRFYGLNGTGLNKEDIEEVLTDYVCDRGHSDKRKYIPLLMTVPNLEHLLLHALDYYRTFFEINTLERLPGPNDLPVRQTILFY